MKRMFFLGQFVFVFSVFFVTPSVVDSASLYIDPPTKNVFRGDAVTLSVRLDTDEVTNECINAVNGVITYPSNIEPVDYSVGNSIFSIWVETPKINKEARTITFAGGIPNGYCGRVIGDPMLSNILVDIVFRSPGFTVGGSGGNTATIALSEESSAYLNDGRGTRADLTVYPAVLTLDPNPSTSTTNVWQDKIELDEIPPEEFSISIQKDDFAFFGKYFIVFGTGDKQTGIDHYEIMEEPLSQLGAFHWGRANAPWVTEQSPYILKDQTLNSVIRVKAIDKAGNEYIASIVPKDGMQGISTTQILFGIIVLFALMVLLAAGFMVIRFLRSKRKSSDSAGVDTSSADFSREEKDLNPDSDSSGMDGGGDGD